MSLIVLILLGVIAFGVIGISGSLRRLYEHHLRFAPDGVVEAGPGLCAGDVLVVRQPGFEQVTTVLTAVVDGAGKTYVTVEPAGAR